MAFPSPPPPNTPEEGIQHLQDVVTCNGTGVFQDLLQPRRRLGHSRDADDLTAVMFTAIRKDDAEVVESLLRSGMRVSHPFVKAAASASAKGSLRVFIQHGWDINTPMSRTEPPAWVYGLGNEDMALWLLGHGADLNAPTYIDFTPMSYAVRHARPALVAELLRRGGDVERGELLHHALGRTSDSVPVLAMLLARGAPSNATKYENHAPSREMYHFMELGTPLHRAAALGNLDAVWLLLTHGANPTIRDNKGRTAEESAVEAGRDEVALVLRLETASDGVTDDTATDE